MEEEKPLEKGVKYLQHSQYEKALGVFDKLIESEPNNSDAHKNRGLAHMNLYAYDKAIVDFKKTLELTPKARGVHSNLGVAWYYKKDYAKAVSHYGEELRLDPKNHFALFNRAISLSEMEENDRALADITQALELKSDFYLARCLQGDLYLKQNRLAAARRAYGTALALDSNQTYAQEQLARLDERDAAPSKKETSSVAQRPSSSGTTVAASPGGSAPSVENYGAMVGKKVASPKQIQKVAMNDAPPVWNYSPPAQPRALKKGYTLQVGAFRRQANALAMEKRLDDKGFHPRLLQLTDSKGQSWFLVRLGYFARKEAAQDEHVIFKQMTGIKAIVRPIGKF